MIPKRRPLTGSIFHRSRACSFGKYFSLAIGLTLPVATQHVHAVADVWLGANNGIWDTTTVNWSPNNTFTGGDDALFSGTPTNNVTSAASLTIGSITLDNTFIGSVTMTGVAGTANTVTGAITVNGGTLTETNTSTTTGTVTAGSIGTASVAIGSGGTFIIDETGNGASGATRDLTVNNTFTGTGLFDVKPSEVYTNGWSTVNLAGNLSGFTGTLDIFAGASSHGKAALAMTTQANVLSSSATVKVESGATLYLSKGLNYGFSTQVSGTGNVEGVGALRIEGNSNLTGSVTLLGNTNVGSSTGIGTVSGNIAESGGSFALTKVGTQTIALTGNNTYSGGTTVSAGTLSVGGSSPLGTGTVTMSGGTTLAVASAAGVTISNAFTFAGAQTTTAANGPLTLNGNISGTTAAAWNLNSTNKITLGGTNSLTLAAGTGMIVNAGAGGVDITGSTTISGAANSNSGYLTEQGNVTLTIQTGGSLTINGTTNATIPNTIIGQNAGTSTLTINGGSFTVGGNTGFVLGNNNASGIGTLTLTSGTVTITAGSTTLQNAKNFVSLGRDNASGTINLSGGTLATGRQFVRDGSTGGTVGAGSATFNFNGGTLQAQANQTSGNGWFETATTGNFQVVTTNVLQGGAVIDTNGFNATINTVLANGGTGTDGGLTKVGSGTLNLGAANTYTGITSVQNGTLALGVSGSISGTVVLGKSGVSTGLLDVSAQSAFSQANISGNGTINIGAGKTVTATGNVAPGFSVGTLNVTGSFTLAPTAVTTLDVGGSGAGQFDLIAPTDTATFGGTLTISSFGGYDLTQSASYGLFSASTFTSASTVDFSGVTVNGVSLFGAGTGVWSGTDGLGNNYSFSDSTGILSVIAVPEPGAASMLAGGLGVLGLWSRRRNRMNTSR